MHYGATQDFLAIIGRAIVVALNDLGVSMVEDIHGMHPYGLAFTGAMLDVPTFTLSAAWVDVNSGMVTVTVDFAYHMATTMSYGKV